MLSRYVTVGSEHVTTGVLLYGTSRVLSGNFKHCNTALGTQSTGADFKLSKVHCLMKLLKPGDCRASRREIL
jgi:hypothetical protein